jgi:hypothetical protein
MNVLKRLMVDNLPEPKRRRMETLIVKNKENENKENENVQS